MHGLSLEVWNMLHCKQKFIDAAQEATENPLPYGDLELDMQDMFSSIDKPKVIPAIEYILSRLQAQSSRSCCPVSSFAISKISKEDDRFGSGTPRCFVTVPLPLVFQYLCFELHENSLFRAGSWVLHPGCPNWGPPVRPMRLPLHGGLRNAPHWDLAFCRTLSHVTLS